MSSTLVMVSVFEIFLNVKMAVYIENNHSLVVVLLEEYPPISSPLLFYLFWLMHFCIMPFMSDYLQFPKDN